MKNLNFEYNYVTQSFLLSTLDHTSMILCNPILLSINISSYLDDFMNSCILACHWSPLLILKPYSLSNSKSQMNLSSHSAERLYTNFSNFIQYFLSLIWLTRNTVIISRKKWMKPRVSNSIFYYMKIYLLSLHSK